MKVLKALIIILLLVQVLVAENKDKNKMNISKLIKPGLKKIEKNILSLESRNIGIYGFDIKTDNKEFNISKVLSEVSKVLNRDISKLKKVEIIGVKKLSKAENKYNIFETYGVKRRQMLNNYFNEADMDLLITGKMIYKNNELTISLSYIDKKRLSEIRVLNKKINEKRILISYFKKGEPKLNPEKYISPVITKTNTRFLLYNKDAQEVMLSFKGENKPETKPMPMKKINKNQGFWDLKLILKPGKYKYLYIIDGKEQFDPKNSNKEDDGFAGIISIVEVKESEGILNAR